MTIGANGKWTKPFYDLIEKLHLYYLVLKVLPIIGGQEREIQVN
jgi:hypothetical protein